MTHPYFASTALPRILAHRGLTTAAGGDPSVWDNTALAFAAADAAGAVFIETDCRITADGEVVLIHDATLERFLGDARRIAEVTTAELSAMFAPHGGLLTVREALEAFPRTRFNIDVKSEDAAEPLGPILAAHSSRVLLTSFSDRRRERAVAAVLRAGAEVRPATSAGRSFIARSLLLSTARLPVDLRDIDALQIPERFGRIRVLTRALLDAAHARGVEVHVWTVNDIATMHRLVGLGVDGIVTDHADLALAALPSR